MHAVVFQVDLIPGREQQGESELNFLTGMLKSTPGFVRGTWAGDDTRGLSFLLFDTEEAARNVADNGKMPPDGSATFRSVDVYAVARDI
jgi:hypothetical protein